VPNYTTHSLNHALCHPEFLPPPPPPLNTDDHPVGHPKLLQKNAPHGTTECLTVRSTKTSRDLFLLDGDVTLQPECNKQLTESEVLSRAALLQSFQFSIQ